MQELQFLRLSRLIGDDKVNLLHTKSIAIVGVGAVGGFALESLARSGVGKIKLVDFDTISETNINRQIIATHSSVGKNKVDVAKMRVLDINPNCEVEALNIFASNDNYLEIFKGVDLVLDCIDSLNPKCSLLEAAVKNNVPIISSMGAALKRDITLIRYSDLFDTWGCSLARIVRKMLRRRGIEKGIDCVFSPEIVDFEFTPIEEEENYEFNSEINTGRQRMVLGSLPTITATFGEYMAHLALQKLLGEKDFKGEAAWNPQLK